MVDNIDREDNLSSDNRPSRPAIHFDPAGVPEELRRLASLINWRFEFRHDDWAKVPRHFEFGLSSGHWIDWESFKDKAASGWRVFRIDHLNPINWLDWEQVASFPLSQLEFWERTNIGVGMVLSEDDPYTIIDLDKCRDPATGEVSQYAAAVVARFDSYTEISNSLTGLKIFVRGKKPGKECKPGHKRVEIYDHKRFNAITGLRFENAPLLIFDRQAELDAFYFEEFPHDTPEQRQVRRHRVVELQSVRPTELQDMDLLDRIAASATGDEFARLWSGDTSSADGDQSSADFRLANILAFWCQGDAGRVESLMRQSGLVRAKWDRADYLPRTIERAISGKTEFYDPQRTHRHIEERQGMTPAEVTEACKFAFASLRGDPAKIPLPPCGHQILPPPSPTPASRLPDFSEFAAPLPAETAQRIDEEAAQKRTQDSSRSSDSFGRSYTRCQSATYKTQAHPEKQAFAARRLNCARWVCPHCGTMKAKQFIAHTQVVLNFLYESDEPGVPRTDPLYIGNVSGKDAWATIRKQLQREGAERMSVSESKDERIVCATKPFEGSEEVAAGIAATRMRVHVDSLIGKYSVAGGPIHFSDRWKMPPPEPSGWKTIGSLPPVQNQEAAIVEKLEAREGTVELKGSRSIFCPWTAEIHLVPRDDESIMQAAQRIHEQLVADLLGLDTLNVDWGGSNALLRPRPATDPNQASFDDALRERFYAT